MIIRKLKQLWDKFKNKYLTEHEVRERNITGRELKDINKDIEKARAREQAKNARLQEENKQLKSQLYEQEKVNIGEQLTKEKQEMRKDMYKKSVSLNKLTNYLHENTVLAKSQDMQTTFGRALDIAPLKDGRIAVIGKTENGNVKPFITGRTMRDIFFNYKDLKSSIANGIMILNLDEDGNFVENITTRRVPNMKMDFNGNFVVTERNEDELQKIIAQKERQIQQLYNEVKTSQEAWMRENEEKLNLQQELEVAKELHDDKKQKYKKGLIDTKEMLKDYDEMNREMHEMLNTANISEDMAQALFKHKDEFQDKMSEFIDKDEKKMAQDDVKEMVNWVMRKMVKEKKAMEDQAGNNKE